MPREYLRIWYLLKLGKMPKNANLKLVYLYLFHSCPFTFPTVLGNVKGQGWNESLVNILYDFYNIN